MSGKINYFDLFYFIRNMIGNSIDNTSKFTFISSVDDIKVTKKVCVYLNLLISQSKDINKYFDTVIMMCKKEEHSFLNDFMYSFLILVDEDALIEDLFNNKEEINNNNYLKLSDTLLSIKNFKNMMEAN